MKDACICCVEEKKLPVPIICRGEILGNDQALDQSEDQEKDLTNGIDQNVTTECTEIEMVFSRCLIHGPAPLEICSSLSSGNANVRALVDLVAGSDPARKNNDIHNFNYSMVSTQKLLDLPVIRGLIVLIRGDSAKSSSLRIYCCGEKLSMISLI